MVLDGAILDVKTGARAWTQDQADRDQQLTAYCWMGSANGLLKPDTDGAFEAAIVYATPKKVSVRRTRRSEADFAGYRARTAAVAGAVGKGVHPPANDGWWHSPEWCKSWYDCPYRGGAA